MVEDDRAKRIRVVFLVGDSQVAWAEYLHSFAPTGKEARYFCEGTEHVVRRSRVDLFSFGGIVQTIHLRPLDDAWESGWDND